MLVLIVYDPKYYSMLVLIEFRYPKYYSMLVLIEFRYPKYYSMLVLSIIF